MPKSDFTYYAMRSRKQRLMEEHASSPQAAKAHKRLANAYADKAALAALGEEEMA